MWECAIGDCEYLTDDVDALLIHQADTHARHQCAICGTVITDGYFAIKHAFSEHSRADYLRRYEADTDDIRVRENILKEIEAVADVKAVVERLNTSEDTSESEAPSPEST